MRSLPPSHPSHIESVPNKPQRTPRSVDQREKARERQRRKRERDRAMVSAMTADATDPDAIVQANPGDSLGAASSKKKPGGKKLDLSQLPPEEAAKRARFRLAARERQRKHRAGVKAKRMAELGMAIVNESGDIEQTAIGYTVNGNGQYEAVLVHPNDPNLHHSPLPFHPPQAHNTAGQLFASTLLIGLSWFPGLKQELLRRLRVSNEELSSFEPVMAAAFDHWQHQRSLQYASQNQTTAPSHIQAHSAPYHPSFNRFQRPMLAAFPPSPHQGPDRSPSPSEESQAGGHTESEVRDIELPTRLYPAEDQYPKQQSNEDSKQ